MKNKNNYLFLGLSVLCGAIAGVLRARLMSTGMDDTGLLIPGQWHSTALWVISVGYLAVLAVLSAKLGKSDDYGACFPACRLRFGLSVAGGILLLAESARLVQSGQTLPGVLGLLAGIAMAAGGWFRLSGKAPNPAIHTVVCVFFIVRLILSFRSWSADPQLQDYAMQMMACLCLMMFSFHRASCDAKLINRPRTVFFGLAAVYFCLASLSDRTGILLYLAGAVWAVGANGTFRTLTAPEE